jgi:lipopolysaccharide transport system ATP-binding protein
LPVIVLEDAWKRFRIPHGRRPIILDQIAGALSLFDAKRYSYEELWALKAVSFELEKGESLGIIGPNGSGKSTLLKIIAGVMRLDKGRVITNGSATAILELGIGFHDDLTVKENAIIYGVIMGMPRHEMKGKTESILEFAKLTRFRDAKLRTLSSGMQVRLAFSIAVQTEADVFLVDEALAVGDLEFQEKCLNKFRDFKKQGRTIVLVSHNLELVRTFCEKTLYLLNGETRAFGASDEATQEYMRDVSEGRPKSLTR